MAQGPPKPDDQWERSMLKGLDAFFAHEHERETSPASPAPRPDPKDRTADAQPSHLKDLFAPATPIGEPPAPADQPDPALEAMLSAFAKHADPPSDPEPSFFERVELPEERPRPTTRPVLVHESERRQRPQRLTLADGVGSASRLVSVVNSRTRDYLRSARSNFTRPVFKQPPPAKKNGKKSIGLDGREAAVIALSIVGLAEVGWIGWRVTNPPPPSAVLVNRGVKSSEAVKVETETVATKPSPATQPKNAAPARSKSSAPAPTPATKAPVSPAVAKESPPEPATTATSGSTSGWVTITSSAPVEVFEQGRRLTVRGGRVSLPAGRHNLEFRSRGLGTTRRIVAVAANTETPVPLDEPGSVNVNALPWASVIVDGAPVGDTPLANLALSAGPHDVVFKHPELGERRLKVTVTPGTPLRVSTDLRSAK